MILHTVKLFEIKIDLFTINLIFGLNNYVI
jgi:hypothetical protein